jgi:lipopolysaccharide assembly protein A
MQILIILALVIAVVAVIFALQNIAAVTVSLFFWHINGSLALVLLITLAAGVLISLLASMPGTIKRRWTISNLKKKLAAAESERTVLQKKTEDAEKEVAVLEEQVASLSGELEKYLPEETAKPT